MFFEILYFQYAFFSLFRQFYLLIKNSNCRQTGRLHRLRRLPNAKRLILTKEVIYTLEKHSLP